MASCAMQHKTDILPPKFTIKREITKINQLFELRILETIWNINRLRTRSWKGFESVTNLVCNLVSNSNLESTYFELFMWENKGNFVVFWNSWAERRHLIGYDQWQRALYCEMAAIFMISKEFRIITNQPLIKLCRQLKRTLEIFEFFSISRIISNLEWHKLIPSAKKWTKFMKFSQASVFDIL